MTAGGEFTKELVGNSKTSIIFKRNVKSLYGHDFLGQENLFSEKPEDKISCTFPLSHGTSICT